MSRIKQARNERRPGPHLATAGASQHTSDGEGVDGDMDGEGADGDV